jgi:hypothetical protein
VAGNRDTGERFVTGDTSRTAAAGSMASPGPERSERARSWSATVTWWLVLLIMAVGVCAGLLLARIERVRIRHDEPTIDVDDS